MAFTTIPSSWLDVGDPTKKELFDRIKANEDDLDSRVGDTEASLTNETPIQFQVTGPYWNEASFPINDAAHVIRIPFNIELTSAVLHVVDDGSSGTLDVDVEYKRGVAAWTTIFSTRPSLANGGGDNSIATNGVISVTDLNAADFLMLKIVTAQIGNERFNLFLTWEIRT